MIFCKKIIHVRQKQIFCLKWGNILRGFPILEIDWKYHVFWHARTGGKKKAVFRAKITQSWDKLWNHCWTQCLGRIVFANVVCLQPICFCKQDLSYLGWPPISKRCSSLISCQNLVQRLTASKRTVVTYISFLFTPHDSGKNMFITCVVVGYDVPQSALHRISSTSATWSFLPRVITMFMLSIIW